MNLSDAGIRFIANEEGVRTRIYKDQAGLPTIGVGHLLSREELELGEIYLSDGQLILIQQGQISYIDALALLHHDALQCADRVAELVKVELTQYQFDALVSLAFNIGSGAFARSTLLKQLNNQNFDAVPDQFRQWNKVTVGGRKQISKGLVARREREANLWMGHTPIQPIQPIKEHIPMLEALQGRKTYLTAAVMIGIGLVQVAGYTVPGFDPANAGQLIAEGFGFFFVRMGIRQ